MAEQINRIVYIEPNDLLQDVSKIDCSSLKDTLNFTNGKVIDNLSIRNEDLTMCVDLQVIMPDRFGVTGNPNDDTRVLYTTAVSVYDEKKIASLMSGSEIYVEGEANYHELTTDYTNVSYTELRKGKKSNTENLCVKSIAIKFNSNFFPVVTMTLVDVRGYALMMPSECAYMSSLRDYDKDTHGGEDDTVVKGSFFRALFHIPYPKFVLTIKGYYGKPVTFNLCVNTFKSAFDSNTGDFNVTVTFIGYVYGIYTDLPFSLLLVAPYIGNQQILNEDNITKYENAQKEYASENGAGNREEFNVKNPYYLVGSGQTTNKNDAWNNKDFVYYGKNLDATGGETKIDTFLEFFKKMTDIKKNFKEGDLKSEKEDCSKYQKKIDTISAINSKFIDFKKSYDELWKKLFNEKATLVDNDDNKYLFFEGEKGTKVNVNRKNVDNVIELQTDLLKAISDAIEEKVFDDSAITSVNSDVGGQLFSSVTFFNLSFSDTYEIGDEIGFSGYKNVNTFINEKDSNATQQKKLGYISIYANELQKKNYVAFNTNMPNDKIRSFSKGIESVINIYSDKKNEYTTKITNQILKFQPTVRNIYRMIFAHMSCFMQIFYAVIAQIDKDMQSGDRKLKKMKISVSETDMANVSNVDGSLAPFPLLYRRNGETQEMVFPGDDERFANIPEVAFVNDIFRTVMLSKETLDEMMLGSAYASVAQWQKSLQDMNNNYNALKNQLTNVQNAFNSKLDDYLKKLKEYEKYKTNLGNSGGDNTSGWGFSRQQNNGGKNNTYSDDSTSNIKNFKFSINDIILNDYQDINRNYFFNNAKKILS